MRQASETKARSGEAFPVGDPSGLQPTRHVSVIAVSRNDDHGGDVRSRMQHFVNGFIAQCRKHGLDAELLLVEWNPPRDRPALEDALEWPAEFGPASVSVITVPPELHAIFPHSASLPLFQMIGKNVGIRRARGRFILATNIDILLDDATVLFLRDRLKPGIMLRADRYDVPGDLHNELSFERVLAECRARFFQINTRFGTLDARHRRLVGQDERLKSKLLALYCEIRIFGLDEPMTRAGRWIVANTADIVPRGARWISTFVPRGARWISSFPTRAANAAHRTAQVVLGIPAFFRRNFFKLWPLKTMPHRGYWYIRRALRHPLLSMPAGNMIDAMQWLARKLGRMRRLAARLQIVGPFSTLTRLLARSRWSKLQSRTLLNQMRGLHTNACGDFTLLARDDWFRLRGYPEWPIFSWHIDSIFMFSASAHHIQEVALGAKCRIYHIDHSKGSGWSYDGAARLFERLDRAGIPYIRNEMVSRIQTEFAHDPSAAIMNDENWGLVEFDLPQREVIPMASHRAGATGRPRRSFDPLPLTNSEMRDSVL
jgi:hypothetical protein